MKSGKTILFDIFLECKDGFYNSTCGAHCGQCLNREICNKVNGTCPSGCNLNFQSPLCQGNCSNLVLITLLLGMNFIFLRLSVKEEIIKVESNFQTGKTTYFIILKEKVGHYSL